MIVKKNIKKKRPLYKKLNIYFNIYKFIIVVLFNCDYLKNKIFA